MRVRLRWCWPAMAPFLLFWALVWAAQAPLIEQLGRDAGVALTKVAPVLLPSKSAEPPLTVLSPLVEPAPAHVVSAAPEKRASKTHRRSATAVAQRPRAIRITEETVLRLANAGVQPRGTFVPAAGERPAGLWLSGVAALGIGLQDGDVLFSAGGQPATSAGSVISLVISARGARVRELRGRIWRAGGEPIELIVEQPYLDVDPSEARKPGKSGSDALPPGGPA